MWVRFLVSEASESAKATRFYKWLEIKSNLISTLWSSCIDKLIGMFEGLQHAESCDIFIVKRGNFTRFCPPEGHQTGHIRCVLNPPLSLPSRMDSWARVTWSHGSSCTARSPHRSHQPHFQLQRAALVLSLPWKALINPNRETNLAQEAVGFCNDEMRAASHRSYVTSGAGSKEPFVWARQGRRLTLSGRSINSRFLTISRTFTAPSKFQGVWVSIQNVSDVRWRRFFKLQVLS